MGAWIEMQESENKTLGLFRRTLYGCVDWNFYGVKSSQIFVLSHPLWVRGLKYGRLSDIYQYIHVAPFMGAWIEI